MPYPEELARQHLDTQLGVAGWIVLPPSSLTDSRPLSLCKLSDDTSRADYVLYLDGKACGIIEAKRADHSLQGVQKQSATYATFRKWTETSTYWQNTLPFHVEANGRQITRSNRLRQSTFSGALTNRE